MEQDVRSLCNVKVESPFWDEALEKAKKMPLPVWLEEGYIRDIQDNYGILSGNVEVLVTAAKQIAASEPLCLLAKTLFCILSMEKPGTKTFTKLEIPDTPPKDAVLPAWDLVWALPIVALMPASQQQLAERGVDADVISDSLSFFDRCLSEFSKKKGRPCLGRGYFLSYKVFVFINYLIIGRLRFEVVKEADKALMVFQNYAGDLRIMPEKVMLHSSGQLLGSAGFTDETDAFFAQVTETETAWEGYVADSNTTLFQTHKSRLDKSCWTRLYSPGDSILKVHIPAGEPLKPSACRESFERARDIFARCYPEFQFKVFLITTWLLSSEMAPYLKPESNILAFRNLFYLCPCESAAVDIYLYLYGRSVSSPAQVDVSTLPENNSLQKGVKSYLSGGNYVHESVGILPFR